MSIHKVGEVYILAAGLPISLEIPSKNQGPREILQKTCWIFCFLSKWHRPITSVGTTSQMIQSQASQWTWPAACDAGNPAMCHLTLENQRGPRRPDVKHNQRLINNGVVYQFVRFLGCTPYKLPSFVATYTLELPSYPPGMLARHHLRGVRLESLVNPQI